MKACLLLFSLVHVLRSGRVELSLETGPFGKRKGQLQPAMHVRDVPVVVFVLLTLLGARRWVRREPGELCFNLEAWDFIKAEDKWWGACACFIPV